MTDTPSFRYAERRIRNLVDTFQAKGICPCCSGRALMAIAMAVCETSMGSADAADLCPSSAMLCASAISRRQINALNAAHWRRAS
jgi:hypothetical protein